LREPLSAPSLAQWSDLDLRATRRGRSYHLYSCAQFS